MDLPIQDPAGQKPRMSAYGTGSTVTLNDFTHAKMLSGKDVVG